MSTIRAATISDLAGTGPATLTGQYAAKAWVNFNGTGTVAIRESANVSSITDSGVGDYTVNFTTALTDANYAVATCSEFMTDQGTGLRTTSSVRLVVRSATETSGVDVAYVDVTVTR